MSERGWTAGEKAATYEPEPGGWIARVRRVRMAGHSSERYQVAVIDPHGIARYTMFASLMGEAARVAEGNVNGRNAKG